MDTWRSVCAQESSRLRAALDRGRHAERLAQHPDAGIDSSLSERLHKALQLAAGKLKRLERGEFHIAVVGTEKAGKSTFINAWLGCDLLPSDMKRCTFTTTRLHSVSGNEKQQLVVTPRTPQGMQDLLHALKAMQASGDKNDAAEAAEDLRSLHEHRESLNRVIQEGVQRIPFTHISEIAAPLRRYVADPSCAHAVARVELFTDSLAATDGIMFYDVPGLNSGLAKHIQETKDMLADSDAVIIVKNIAMPSFTSSEKQIFRFAAEQDSSIAIADKAFLFLSHVDKLARKEALDETMTVIRAECARYGLSMEKCVAGTAAGALCLSGQLKNLLNIEDTHLRDKLRQLFALPANADDATLLRCCGLSVLREKIEQYLATDRINILKASCTRIINDIREACGLILASARQRFPDDPRKARQQHDEQITLEFHKWWTSAWQGILSTHADLAQETADMDARLAEISAQYGTQIAAALDGLPCMQPARRKEIFLALKAKYGDNPAHINTEWRRNYIAPAVDEILDSTTFEMSRILYEALQRYIDKLDGELWHCLGVREKLLYKRRIQQADTYLLWLESALSALFLRFARPVADVLVTTPANTPARQDICKTHAEDLKSVSHYYKEGGIPEFENLQRYSQRGVALFSDAALRQKLGLPALPPEDARAWQDAHTDTSLASMEREVETDMLALKEYFLRALFSSSGIGVFARQELLELRKAFLNGEAVFRAAAEAAFRHGDARLLQQLPPHLQNVEFNAEIVDMISQLAQSLRSMEQAG